jgi:DNA-binding SARP family transcriptional activator/tetratricopeptide (TPR) repeat protein
MPPSDAGATRIQLCGRLKADVEGRHVTPELRGRQGRVLLAYLVLNRGRPVSRDELIEAIWPDAPPADPPAALRTQLSRLRSALGAKALAGRDAVELHLPDDTWIDIEAAEQSIVAADSALKAADWKLAWAQAHIALNIAGRPFLAGVEAAWVEEVRRELEELHLRSREVIARAGIGLGGSELAGAERAARALIRIAPFRESGYLLLMRALVAAGNTAEALRTYDELRNLLAGELGSAPGAEIQALHRRLLGGGGEEGEIAETQPTGIEEPHQASELPLPTWLLPHRRSSFIGRTDELGRLAELWLQAQAGTRPIAFIGGDSGVGKTRLATEFARRVHRGGGGVLYGRADEEGTPAYQPFVEALRHWVTNADAGDVEIGLGPHAGILATLVPEIVLRLPQPPPVPDDVPRELLLDAVAATLATISSAQPTLVIVDDLHWADAGSMLILRHLARSPHPGKLMLVATYRETQPSEHFSALLADLGRERLFERMHLAGLSLAEVVELITSIRGVDPEPGLAETIHAETDGNPFLVEALVDHMSAISQGSPPRLPGSLRVALYAEGVPDLVREAIAHRAGGLGPTGADVLEVASVIGREFESELLVEVSGHPGDEVIAALEAAFEVGLLADVPGTLDRYAFSHALFRQTVYAGISKPRRAQLHLRLGEALERRHGTDPHHVGELARHFSGAGPAASAKALEHSVRAGASALGALAFEQAVEQYSRALQVLDASGSGDETLRCELLIALGEAEWRAGDPQASRDTFSRATRIARRSGDSEALARAALGFSGGGWNGFQGPDPESIELLEGASEANPEPGILRARVLARLAEALHFGGDSARVDEVSREALSEARASGDEEAIAAALTGRWYACLGPDQLVERVEVTRELLGIATRLRNRDIEIRARLLQVAACLERGEFTELDVAIAEHAALADQMKQPLGLLQSRACQAMQRLMEGDFADVERLAGEVLELGALSEDSEAVQYSAIELLLLRWEQDRLIEMEEPVRDLVDRFEAVPAWSSMLAFLLAELGHDEEARRELARIDLDQDSDLAARGSWLADIVFASMAAVKIGDSDRASGYYQALLPYAGRVVAVAGAAAYASSTSHHLGVLAATLGRLDEAVTHLEVAIATNERAGALPWLARARFELARVLAARGDGGDAERAGELLAEAGRTAEELQMDSLLRRLAGLRGTA